MNFFFKLFLKLFDMKGVYETVNMLRQQQHTAAMVSTQQDLQDPRVVKEYDDDDELEESVELFSRSFVNSGDLKKRKSRESSVELFERIDGVEDVEGVKRLETTTTLPDLICNESVEESSDDIPLIVLYNLSYNRALSEKKLQQEQKPQKKSRKLAKTSNTSNTSNASTPKTNSNSNTNSKGQLGFLFVELANPNSEGISRWVDRAEFSKNYERLRLGNGGSWLRKGSTLDKLYHIEVDRSITPGERIDRIRLNGMK
jgi:hypothetical protein